VGTQQMAGQNESAHKNWDCDGALLVLRQYRHFERFILIDGDPEMKPILNCDALFLALL
jgi:hypothetical protein